MAKNLSLDDYWQGIQAGERSVLAQAITLVESTRLEDQDLAAQLLARLAPQPKENTFRLGITGVPGVGKSTFVESFGQLLLKKGHKVAVLAIDPSSPRTRGSLLGDKTRMEYLSREENVFIRPSPAAQALGGIALKTRDTLLLCEAAGYDFILVETVGVGQSEVAVRHVIDYFLLLLLPGAGDELQGMKRGIMEMADGLFLNKAEGDNRPKALAALYEYQAALHLFPKPPSGVSPQITLGSALEGIGLEELYAHLLAYRQQTQANGFWDNNRRFQRLEALHEFIQQSLITRFYVQGAVQTQLKAAEARILSGESEALTEALALLRSVS